MSNPSMHYLLFKLFLLSVALLSFASPSTPHAMASDVDDAPLKISQTRKSSKSAGHGLSPSQVVKLRSLGGKILVPYAAAGFTPRIVTAVPLLEQKHPMETTYEIEYTGPRGKVFSVAGVGGGYGGEAADKEVKVHHPVFGDLSLEIYKGKDGFWSDIFLYGQIEAYSRFHDFRTTCLWRKRPCQTLTLSESIQIVKSLNWL